MTDSYALPQTFCEKLRHIAQSEKEHQYILEAFAKKRPPAIRINTLKMTVEQVIKELTKLKIEYKPVGWHSSALILPYSSTRELTKLLLYQSGALYIQSLSSMIPALVLAPEQTDIVLDLAAAPGSKTTQLATLMKNQGIIIANDIDQKRIFKLKSILNQQGVTNTNVISMSGQRVWEKYPEYFDKVLVDAPCSMEGRFDTSDPKSFSHWSPKKVKNLARLQKWLLRSAFSATKPGGTLVYSTCTLSPEENEEVIDWLLKKESGKVEVKNIPLNIPERTNGLTTYRENQYDHSVTKTVRILPSEIMEGFYIAHLQKLSSNI